MLVLVPARTYPSPTTWRVFLVLHLDPASGQTSAIGQIELLAHDAFQPKLAGVLEDHGAVAFRVLDVFDAAQRPPQELE